MDCMSGEKALVPFAMRRQGLSPGLNVERCRSVLVVVCAFGVQSYQRPIIGLLEAIVAG